MIRRTALAGLFLAATATGFIALFTAIGDRDHPAVAGEMRNVTILHKSPPQLSWTAPADCPIGQCQDI